MDLNLDANINDPDGFYHELLSGHEGLSKAESDALNARLILILANHIGDCNALRRVLEIAKRRTAAHHATRSPPLRPVVATARAADGVCRADL